MSMDLRIESRIDKNFDKRIQFLYPISWQKNNLRKPFDFKNILNVSFFLFNFLTFKLLNIH